MSRENLIRQFKTSSKKPEVLLPAILNVTEIISPADEDYSALSKELNKALISICETSQAEGEKVYHLVLSLLENLNWENTENAQKAFVLLDVFSGEALGLFGTNTNLRAALRASHERVLNLINLLLDKEHKVLHTYKSLLYSEIGYVSFAELLINLYFHHAHYSSSDNDLREAVALTLPVFYEKYPKADSNITFSLLQHHKQYTKQLAHLIARYASGEEIGVIHGIALDLMVYQPKLSKKIPAIIKQLIPLSKNWGVPEWDRLTERFLYYPFENKLQKLAKAVMTSKEKKQFVEWIMASEPDIANYAELKKAIDAENENQASQKVNPLFEGTGVVFKDFNFKLFVINELMYSQNILQPRLDVRDFPGEKIDVEEEGYDIIPKVKDYFKKIVLKEEHLSKITQLNIGATAEIISHIYPFWDGEDDAFDIKKIDDVTHLPNLKEIDFEEFEHLNEKFGKKLKQAGVKLIR